MLTPILKKHTTVEKLASMSNVKSPSHRVQFALPKDDMIDVIDAIKDYSSRQGAASVYKKFVTQLLCPDTEDKIVISWLHQLKDNISLLDRSNEAVVSLLLKWDYTSRSESVTSVYQELILNLVSAHTYYIQPVLRMILQQFLSGHSLERKSVIDDTSVTEDDMKIFDQAHKLLQEILSLVPLASTLLLCMAVECFPYLRKDLHGQVAFITNLFRIYKYLPSQRHQILELILHRMLQIDLHTPKAEILESEQEDDEDDMDTETVFSMDHDQTVSESDASSTSMRHPLANVLDLVMEQFLRFIDSNCRISEQGKVLDWDETKRIYKEILTLFDKVILPTHGCAHVQFLMFYICSLRPALLDGFLDYLWKKVQNPNTPPVLRQASAGYIGSLLARAQYIEIGTVTACLNLMCSWAHSYIDSQSGSSRTYVDIRLHGTFYAVCQALFYVVAFRHKELVEMKTGVKYLRSLNFERLITCRLNPLKVCAPAVVTNFANVARNYQVAYCYTVIERNNRSVLPVLEYTASGAVQPIMAGTLEAYFPFDPYLLKRSASKVTPIYRVYEGSRDDVQEESVDHQEDDFLKSTGSSPTSYVSTLPELLSYSTSPGFKQVVSPKLR